MRKITNLFVDFSSGLRGTSNKPWTLVTHVYPKHGSDHIEIANKFSTAGEAARAIRAIAYDFDTLRKEHPDDTVDLGVGVIPVNNIGYISHELIEDD